MTKLVLIAAALTLAIPVACSAQGMLGPASLGVNRAELTSLLAEYDAVAQSSAYSDVLREEVRGRADSIRTRLSSGDFRAGDRIALFIDQAVAGAPSVQWDTLVVETGRTIEVSTLGLISLQGVLRSELDTHLMAEVGRFIQNPRVRARALIRVSMIGVGQPGFHTLPVDLPLSDAVMLAGGPSGSDPGRIRVERGQDVLWSVEELLGPVAAGRTLDELGLQAGDRIVLPVTLSPAGGGVQGQFLQRTLQSAPFIVISLILGRSIR